MEYFYPEGQFVVAVYFALVGCALCMLYDIFRIKREFFGSTGVTLFVDDLLYTSVCTVCIILGILKINSGNIRWYETFFVLAGFLIYRATLSRIITGFFFLLSRLIKRMLSVLAGAALKLLRPVSIPILKLFAYLKTRKNNFVLKLILFKYKIEFIRKIRKVSLKTGEI